ncbi:MAG TPA: NAD-dependent deacylase [Anaerolineales bacterium]
MLLMVPGDFNIPIKLIFALRNANRVTALTGAGISAESGVPTFRDAQSGLWAQYDPEELATRQAFRQNPQLVWEWYTWRKELISAAQPNPGHFALTKLENMIPPFTLITQNVDGLHQAAGSQSLIELHGNIFRTKCFQEDAIVDSWNENGSIPPRCPNCGGMLRPDVVWFGESLPREALSTAQDCAQRCDVFLSIGTSTLVEPAASLPFLALQSGASVAEINPQQTPLSPQAHAVIQASAGKALPVLVQATSNWSATE